MKLTVLGKYGPFPKAGEGATSGYLLEDGSAKIALDMGSGVLSRLMAATDIAELDAVFISHLHFDHTSDLLPMRYLLDSLNKRLTVITQAEQSQWYDTLFDSPRFDMIHVNKNSELHIKGLTLTFAPMKHPVPCFAVKIGNSQKSFVYTGDTVFFDGLTAFASGADAILSNCTKPIGFTGPHMTTADAIKLAEATGATVLASHFAPDDDPFEDLAGHSNIIPVQEGKTYEI